MENGLNDSKVRIITKNDIRYEGTLYQINSNEKTIALKDVLSYGTEDRTTEKSIPPSDFIYEIIVFRSCEIKHLIVLKTKPEDQKEEVVKEVIKEDKKTDEVTKEQEVVVKKDPKVTEKQEEKITPPEIIQNMSETPKQDTIPEKAFSTQNEAVFEFSSKFFENLKEIESKKVVKQNTLNYKKCDFFDNLTTTVNQAKNAEKDIYHNKNITKETFGSIPENNYSNYHDEHRNNHHQNNRNYQNRKNQPDRRYNNYNNPHNNTTYNNTSTHNNYRNNQKLNTNSYDNKKSNSYKGYSKPFNNDSNYRGGTGTYNNNRRFQNDGRRKEEEFEYVRKSG